MTIERLNSLTETLQHLKSGKFTSDIFANLVSFVLMGICGLLLNILIAWKYDAEVLGVFNQVFAIYTIFSQIAILGIHWSVMKYSAEYYQQPEIYRPEAAGGLILSVFVSGLFSLAFWGTRNITAWFLGSPDVANGIAMAAVGLFFLSLNKVSMALMNGLSRMKEYAVYQSLRYIFLIVSAIGCVFFVVEGKNLGIIFTLSEVLLFFILLPFVVRHMEFRFPYQVVEWMVKHLKFGMKGFLGVLLSESNSKIGILILGFFSDDRTVGIFSFASTAAIGFLELIGILKTIYNPILVQSIASNNLDELKVKIARGVRTGYLIFGALGLIATLIFPIGIYLMTNKAEFMESWPVFAILIAGIVSYAGYVPFSSLLLQAGFPGIQTILNICIVIINVLGNFLLVPIWGGIGSALALGLTYALSALLLKGFTSKVLKILI